MPYPDFGLSFEFFPPNSPAGAIRLWNAVEQLAPLGPDFVSVTYGAGGSTRERTYAAIKTIRERARLNVAGHLTCVGASRDETLAVARKYRAMGVRRIVALRGDPPKDTGQFTPHPEGFRSGAELAGALAGEGMEVSVAAYPETHPEAVSAAADLDVLKAKQDAGAHQAITQFFFDNADFLRFRDRAVAAGITLPILPGILPVEDFTKMCRFAATCNAKVPDWMHRAFGRADTAEDAHLLAVAIAAEQCDALLSEGVPHLHIYTLNRPDLALAVATALGRGARAGVIGASTGAA